MLIAIVFLSLVVVAAAVTGVNVALLQVLSRLCELFATMDPPVRRTERRTDVRREHRIVTPKARRKPASSDPRSRVPITTRRC